MTVENLAMTFADAKRLIDQGVDPMMLVRRGFQIATELRLQLLETRLETLEATSSKEAFIAQSRDVAMSLARALEMVEVAYHAGHADGRCGTHFSPEVGYRAWEAQIAAQERHNKEAPCPMA